MAQIFLLIVLVGVTAAFPAIAPTPVVLWHGLDDSWVDIGHWATQIEQEIPGVYTRMIRFEETPEHEKLDTFILNANIQVERACQMIRNDSNLQSGYHAVGFSQGSQFLRALVQRCPTPPMKNFVTFGGQHQGVFGVPKCPLNHTVCNWARELLNYGAYTNFVQDTLVQAQYWHDPLNENTYREKSIFIAEINNERIRNPEYKKNLMQLNKFVMIKFSRDEMVTPNESSWFGFYTPGQSEKITPLRESQMYKEDWLGLKYLDENGRLEFRTIEGLHVQISSADFSEVIQLYLKDR